MKMKDWSQKLDAFLTFNEQEILQDKGRVSHEAAIALAEKEYEKFRVEQDKKYISDFDKIVEKAKQLEKKVPAKHKTKKKKR